MASQKGGRGVDLNTHTHTHMHRHTHTHTHMHTQAHTHTVHLGDSVGEASDFSSEHDLSLWV